MAIQIIRQILEMVITQFLKSFGETIRKADKHFWQGYVFGQMITFGEVLLVIYLFHTV
jgi:hypothetical protein